MSFDWCKAIQGPDLRLENQGIRVYLPDSRAHLVKVEDAGEYYEFSSKVAGSKAFRHIPEFSLAVWMRNRESDLVGFRFDSRGSLIAESWCPKIGVDAEELKLIVRTLAAEADRFEYAITGKDLE